MHVRVTPYTNQCFMYPFFHFFIISIVYEVLTVEAEAGGGL
jgi:hypothetical protein